MEQQGSKDRILSKVDASRRDFVKRVLGVAAFAAPVIASFSIDGLSIESAEAQAFPSGPSGCAVDTGYNGPVHYQAQLADPSGATGVTGEVNFTVEGDNARTGQTREIDTKLSVTKNATVLSAYISVNGIDVANFPEGQGVIGTGDVQRICDFDALLQAMALEQTMVVVQGVLGGNAFTITGAIEPKPGETISLGPQ